MGKIRELKDDVTVLWSVWKKLLSFFDKYAPRERMTLFIAVLFLSFICSPTFPMVAAWLRQLPSLESVLLDTFDHPINHLIHLFCSGHGRLPLLCFAGCLIFSYFFCVATTLFIKSVAYRSPETRKDIILVDQLIYRLGVQALHLSIQGETVKSQDYAPWIISSVANSKKVRMLSIAGYEYLGRGTESLLYDTLIKHPDIEFQLILLDPASDSGKAAIAGRVKELADREPSITGEKIASNIASTIDTVRQMSQQWKGKIEVRHCDWHPIFRLVICDKEMFLSVYGKAVHGHETPVIQILKKASGGDTSDTLYHSWEKYFDALWEHSKPVKL